MCWNCKYFVINYKNELILQKFLLYEFTRVDFDRQLIQKCEIYRALRQPREIFLFGSLMLNF